MTVRITTLLLVLLAALLPADHVRPDEGTELRLMTYNIRYDTPKDGENAWPNRREAVIELIRFHRPELLGVQEALVHQRDWMQGSLPGYIAVGVGRDDGRSGGELSPLFIKQERFDVHESGTFWLSTTPHKPSRGWDAAFPRIATWARVSDRVTGLQYLAVNTHWDHRGNEARIQSARLILGWLVENSKRDERLILMGDLNSTPSSKAYQALFEGGLLTDSISSSELPPYGPRGTYNGFDVFNNGKEAIDHILLSPEIRVLRHGVITQQAEGRVPSDHYPVLADIE